MPRRLYPPEGGAVLLALPVGVIPLEEGQSAFYQGPRVREQPMVAILYPYLMVLPEELPSGENHGGSQDPINEGYQGRAHHGGPCHPDPYRRL